MVYILLIVFIVDLWNFKLNLTFRVQCIVIYSYNKG